MWTIKLNSNPIPNGKCCTNSYERINQKPVCVISLPHTPSKRAQLDAVHSVLPSRSMRCKTLFVKIFLCKYCASINHAKQSHIAGASIGPHRIVRNMQTKYERVGEDDAIVAIVSGDGERGFWIVINTTAIKNTTTASGTEKKPPMISALPAKKV